MARILYELLGRDDRRFSPYCWRTRFALAHLGLELDEIVPCGFTEMERVAFSGGKTVPVLVDGDVTIRDSWDIAVYLDETYGAGAHGPLWDGAQGRHFAHFINFWTDRSVHPPLFQTIIGDVFARVRDEDQAYFRETREKRFGKTIEAMAANRETHQAALAQVLTPMRAILSAQDYLCGAAPAYADYVVLGTFQWARCTSPHELLAQDDPIHAWRERLLDLYDGLGRKAKIAA